MINMRKNKFIITILILLISSIFIFALCNNVLANTIIDPDFYEPGSLDNPTGADKIRDIGNTIIGFIQILGSILSVVVLAILGIRYMLGSVEEKAQYKKTMVPYVIGAIMVFGITNILGIASNIFKNLL